VIRADDVDQHLGRTNPGGDLLDDAPRHGRSVASPTSYRMPSGNSFSPSSLRSTPTTVNPAVASFCTVTRPNSPPAPTTIATRALIPQLSRPSPRPIDPVQVRRRHGERSSPDSGDLVTIYAGLR
jgi:hypothetical protein